MQQPMNQPEPIGGQQAMSQQMVLCPVRFVYETQVLVQPGDQIQPNQTFFLNPQNTPPWMQNRPAAQPNPVVYVQQMPNNMVHSVQQHMDQNQLYLQQNFANFQLQQHMLTQNHQEMRPGMQLANIVPNMVQNVQQNMQNNERNMNQNANAGQMQVNAQQIQNQMNVRQIQNQGNQNVELQRQLLMNTRPQMAQQMHIARPVMSLGQFQNLANMQNVQIQHTNVGPTFMQHIGQRPLPQNVNAVRPQIVANNVMNVQPVAKVRELPPAEVNKTMSNTVGAPVPNVRNFAQNYNCRPIQPRRRYVENNASSPKMQAQQVQGQNAQVQQILGQNAQGQKVLGQNTQGQQLLGQTAQAQQALGQTAQAQQALGQNAQAQQVLGQNTQGQHVLGQNAQGQQVVGINAQGQQVVGLNAHGQQVVGQNAQDQPILGQNAQGQQVAGQNAQGQQVVGLNAQGQQVLGQNAQGQQVPVQTAQAQHIPVQTAPTQYNPEKSNSHQIVTNIATNTTFLNNPNVSRKRKSESPDEIQNKKVAQQTKTNPTMKPIYKNVQQGIIITKLCNEIGTNTSPVHKPNINANNAAFQMNPNPQMVIVENAEQKDENLIKNITEAKRTAITPAPSDSDKLIRNTVYTQARGRLLQDKISENFIPQSPQVIENKVLESVQNTIDNMVSSKVQTETNTMVTIAQTEKATMVTDEKYTEKKIQSEKDTTINQQTPVSKEIETPETKPEIINKTVETEQVNIEIKEKQESNVNKQISQVKDGSSEATNQVSEVIDEKLEASNKIVSKQDILTHVVDGYVIQESNFAFPIRKPLKEKTLYANPKAESESTDALKECMKEEMKNTGVDVQLLPFHYLLLHCEKKIEEEDKEDSGKPNPFSDLPHTTVKSWTVEDLSSHLLKFDWKDTALVFQDHEIDGESLFLVSKTQLVSIGVTEENADAICEFVRS